MGFRLLLSLRCVFDNKLTPFISENGFGCNVMDSYFSFLNLSFAENYHISIFITFEKQSMINRLSNPINCNRSAAKISKVMSSNIEPSHFKTGLSLHKFQGIKTLNYYKTILAFWITRKKSPSVAFLLLKTLNKTKERFSSDPTDQDAQN